LAGALASALAQRKKKVAESGKSDLDVPDDCLTFWQMMRVTMMIGS
jgi:hypothetical protein